MSVDRQPSLDQEPQRARAQEPRASEPKPPSVSAAQILASRSLEIAELNARIQDSSAAYAKRERRKAISASTREYKYASYMEAWRRKVERVGNLNYPEAAKRLKLYGNLILHVALRSDGSLERVRVLRSSGFDLLDEAAVKIVELAAPFAPFPPDIRSDTDVLDITRTWQFLSSNRLGWEN
jgi:protein TonB